MPRCTCFTAYSPDEIVEKIGTTLEFRPTLGIVFSSVALGIPEVSSAISSLDIPVLGCSTAGEILPVSGESPIQELSAACYFADPDPSCFSVALFERSRESAAELGQRIGEWGRATFEKPAFIIAIAGLKNDGEAVIRGIEAVCPSKTPIFGGIAGDDGEFTETYVFSGESCSTNGAAVIVFDQARVRVDGTASSGWVGVGTEMVVTSSEGNVVYTIDDRPAAQLFKDYLNVDDEALLQVGVTFPLLLKRPDGTEVLRTFLSVDLPEGSLIYAGSVPQGSKVRFSSSFGYEIIERSIQDLKDFHAERQTASLVLLFSCLARYHAAGSMVVDEVEAASALWNAPLIGLFTYGEIGYNRMCTCDLYNETLCIALIDFLQDER
ncbi:FIST signal transduction protein [Methanoculleus frigidifontis]|nr:FIST N-terminal domain-containing protein [Methanoculleus sp. FWC-SCC1]